MENTNAREEKYAQAMSAHRVEAVMVRDDVFGWHCLTCRDEGWSWSSLEQAEQASLTHHARAVMAVANAEVAAARAALARIAGLCRHVIHVEPGGAPTLVLLDDEVSAILRDEPADQWGRK